MTDEPLKVVLFANTDWYLYNFRLSLAKALRKAGHEVLLISPLGSYGGKLRAEGFRWQPIPMERRSLNPIRELMLLLHLWRLFQKEHPALLHGFTIKSAIYGALAARLAGVPARVSAIAGMGYVFISGEIKARLLRPFVRILMRIALNGKNARLILQNEDDVRLFTDRRLVDASRIRLIRGSGVDCSRYVPRSSERDPGKPLTVLLAARLLWDKGIAEYVEAARILKKEGRSIEFLLAGTPDPGNPASVPEATVREWQSDGLLKWLGHVDDMPSLFRETDMVVLPSYREGLPKSLIEAAACGLPMIATDVPGCREVVIDGLNGRLIPVRDTKSLAIAIAGFDDNRDLLDSMGGAARQTAVDQFDERIVLQQTIAVYAELLRDFRMTESSR